MTLVSRVQIDPLQVYVARKGAGTGTQTNSTPSIWTAISFATQTANTYLNLGPNGFGVQYSGPAAKAFNCSYSLYADKVGNGQRNLEVGLFLGSVTAANLILDSRSLRYQRNSNYGETTAERSGIILTLNPGDIILVGAHHTSGNGNGNRWECPPNEGSTLTLAPLE